MSRKAKIIGLTALIMTLLAGTAIAQNPGGWGDPGGGPRGGGVEMAAEHGGAQGGFGMEMLARFRMMFRELDLSEEQINEIHTITETAREEARALMQESGMPEERTPFIEVFASAILTVSDLEETLGQNDEVREAMKDIIFQAIVDVHDVLTYEQLEKLAEMAEEHAGGFGHGPGMGFESGTEPVHLR